MSAWITVPYIVGKSNTAKSLPVILPELIVPVVILLVEVNVSCFKSYWDWVTLPPLEEIILFISIVIFDPGVNIFCLFNIFCVLVEILVSKL